MSVVAAESSESLVTNHQSDIILENGKEDSQGTDEAKCFKDKPVANGSEPEEILSTSETGDVHENPAKQVKEVNSIQGTAGDADSSSVKLPKEDELEPKKQRSGTPQSRSSTPQRKSGRVRSKHDSPNKSTSASTLTPVLKVLKINLTPTKNITNGTMEARSKIEHDNSKAKNVKTTDVEPHKSFDTSAINENDGVDAEETNVQSEHVSEAESSKPQAADAPYLRSLRMVAGRRSLSSNSPSKSLPISSPGSSVASSSQWRKRQSRKKESTYVQDDSEYQGSDNEFNTSVGKRKAERADDQGVEFPVSNVKKSKNEDDDMKLFLYDDSEENNHFENESEEYFNSSQYSKSSDDVLAELKDLSESDKSDDHYVKNESMEYAYEAREIETSEKFHEIPTAANQSSNKRWCILM